MKYRELELMVKACCQVITLARRWLAGREWEEEGTEVTLEAREGYINSRDLEVHPRARPEASGAEDPG